jgi:hypothetical protein
MVKKVLVLVVLVGGIAYAAIQPALQTSSAVVVPDALNKIFAALIFAAVMAGLQWLFEIFGVDLTGFGADIAAVLSAFLIAQLQGFINIIPAQYDQIVTIALNILVVVLGGMGTLRVLFHPQKVTHMLAH